MDDGNPGVVRGIYAAFAGGDVGGALGHYVGTYKATDRPMRTQLVHVWRLADGKATRFQQSADTLQVAHVTGIGLAG